MRIALTTVAKTGDADRLAAGAVERGLAACVEVAAVTSHYRWRGRLERAKEYRLAFKCLPARLPELESWVLGNHPYETPEWVVLGTARVSEKYLSWAEANSTPRPPRQTQVRSHFAMSQHKSLQGAGGIVRRRNVMKRFERVDILKKRGQWKEGDRVVGLRKTRAET